MKLSIHSLACVSALLLASVMTLRADPALLGHKGLAGQTLDADAIKAVLMGKKATLGDTRVIIVIAKDDPAQEAFFKEHLGMTTDQFQTYWRRLFMTGGGSAPKVADNAAAALKLVAETPGAVAVGDSTKADGLTVLTSK